MEPIINVRLVLSLLSILHYILAHVYSDFVFDEKSQLNIILFNCLDISGCSSQKQNYLAQQFMGMKVMSCHYPGAL